MSGNLKSKHTVTAYELRSVLYIYEYVSVEVNVSISLSWKAAFTVANSGDIHKRVEVFTRELRRRSER